MIILGIDPGTATTGFGAIDKSNGKIKFLGCGCIKTFPKDSPEIRLNQIFNEINKLIKEYKPDVLAVEKLFFFKNAKTLIPVSQSKGIILLAAAKKGIPVHEFTPLQVKMNIVGYGRADKKQVQEMIKILLNLKDIPRPDDAADALGLAISYSYLPKLGNS
ncbi:MAG: crossover junction endodeoxyribonuclease RuvC [Patescibacteria group bacterium]|nr:crossover junction endodeoxyribonuclease RuvC [Patescibacteria group bacterium]